MLSTPVIEYRPAQPYAAIERKVKPINIGNELPPLHGEISVWLQKNGLEPSGPPFFLYLAMDKGELLVRVGFAIEKATVPEGDILIDSFPAGKYAVLTYTGDYKDMMQAHLALEKWVSDNGHQESKATTAAGCAWGGRTEFYMNDCTKIPNPAEWETQIAFLLEY